MGLTNAENLNFENYQLIIFDMDGTLYHQKPMQIHMASELLKQIFHKEGWKNIKIIKTFRSIRENFSEAGNVDDKIYRMTAAKLHLNASDVKKTVEKWMYQEPLSYIYHVRDGETAALLKDLIKADKYVVIYSDYPADAKRKALKLPEVPCYCSNDSSIGALKPSPKGIYKIMSDYHIDTPDKVLVIGDRLDKDGKMAENAGADALILSHNRKDRSTQLKHIVL